MTSRVDSGTRTMVGRWAPRHWPAALAACGVVAAIVLTSWLVIRDRDNAAAASSSSANTARDELAVKSLRLMAGSLDLGETMQHRGVFGLGGIGLHASMKNIVRPFGGTLTKSQSGWTLALGGGWACLSWVRAQNGWDWTRVARGICPSAPINATPVVSSAQVLVAIAYASRVQRAAVAAAFATETMGPSDGTLTVQSIENGLRARKSLPFQWAATPYGLSVMVSQSSACFEPTTTQEPVLVRLGACT